MYEDSRTDVKGEHLSTVAIQLLQRWSIDPPMPRLETLKYSYARSVTALEDLWLERGQGLCSCVYKHIPNATILLYSSTVRTVACGSSIFEIKIRLGIH